MCAEQNATFFQQGGLDQPADQAHIEIIITAHTAEIATVERDKVHGSEVAIQGKNVTRHPDSWEIWAVIVAHLSVVAL
jgi:hypothetical protein